MKHSNTIRSCHRCNLMLYFAAMVRPVFLVCTCLWHDFYNFGRIVFVGHMPDCIFSSFPAILCCQVFAMVENPFSCKTRTHFGLFSLGQPVNKSKMHILLETHTGLYKVYKFDQKTVKESLTIVAKCFVRRKICQCRQWDVLLLTCERLKVMWVNHALSLTISNWKKWVRSNLYNK